MSKRMGSSLFWSSRLTKGADYKNLDQSEERVTKQKEAGRDAATLSPSVPLSTKRIQGELTYLVSSYIYVALFNECNSDDHSIPDSR